MALDIKQEVLENIVTTLAKVSDEQVLSGIDGLAKLVRDNEGNTLMEKFKDNCKKMQDSYNDKFLPAINSLREEYGKMSEFDGAIARAAANMADTKTVQDTVQITPVEVPQI